jgi:hypothetical protein
MRFDEAIRRKREEFFVLFRPLAENFLNRIPFRQTELPPELYMCTHS